MTKLEVLKRCPFICELNDEQLQKLEKMCCEEVFEVGEILCKQGRIEEKIYIIVDGLVGIFLQVGPMGLRQLQAASNFEVVGWTAMIPPYRNRGMARALETTKVLTFNGKELSDLCNSEPMIGCKIHRGLASLMGERLHNAFTQLIGVTEHEA